MAEQRNVKELIDRYLNASFIVNKRFSTGLREHLKDDLTVEQYTALQIVGRRGKCTPTELADVFCVGKSTITSLINRLVQRGLMERTGDEKDRRVIYLSITPEGRKVFQVADEQIERILEPYLSHFDEAEIQQFLTSFEKLAQLMQDIE
ncbi:MarR family winged helix-turn-helix transcriptional regulator [Paenibacillus caui]|uniref:MarR family winged helix-turn-helix transcriptional regulator n=1 Tax=Paenibacillus caui TaxID=2873927 RepID=UPI001CA846A4|nr:MarR family transcriptional regulator [Paenibacillus caui]